jgi:hypothetical protein
MIVLCSLNLGVDANAQFPGYFAVTNVGINVACSATNGRYSYYLGSVTTKTSGSVVFSGTRYDVGAGAANGAPGSPKKVSSVPANSKLFGPIQKFTNVSTFTQIVNGKPRTLTNVVVSEAVFASIQLSDGALLKGPWVHNVERTQQANLTWTTNKFYSGQLFLSFSNMMGSTYLGED